MIDHDTGAARPLDDGSARYAQPAGFEPIEADRWHWTFSDDADVAVDVLAPLFDSQGSAEDWLTQNVDDLVDQGVAAVTLFDGEGAVYGPMSLSPEDTIGTIGTDDTDSTDSTVGPDGTVDTDTGGTR
jgi:hypothetical protein